MLVVVVVAVQKWLGRVVERRLRSSLDKVYIAELLPFPRVDLAGDSR